MSRFQVVVTDQVFPSVELERGMLADIEAELTVAAGGLDEVLQLAQDADGLLNTYLPLDAAAIGRLRRCRIIARYGIGVDNIDLEAAAEAGIVVTNVPDYCVEEVVAHTLALLLGLHRKIVEADAAVREGRWTVEAVRPIPRLSELTVGLVGFGKIARRVAVALAGLGVSLQVHDPYVAPGPDGPPLVELDELLRSSDVVSIHAPLTPQTRGLIGKPQLEMMPAHGLLVNTSRGPLVVLDDLIEALRAGTIAGAALDVFDAEPLDPERIRGVPHLITTPHIAYYSEAAIRESQRKAATQVVKVLTGGEPDYPVGPAVSG
ncbi:MAG: C-terminal binding protein [Acidimicrobiia bacterium]